MKTLIKNILSKTGYSIILKKKIYPNDLRKVTSNPLVAKYLARKNSFLINAKPSDCRILNWFECTNDGTNPFVNTVRDIIIGKTNNYDSSIMKRYYEIFQPNNVANIFGFKNNVHDDLNSYPPYSMVFPWENASMKSRKEFRSRYVLKENEDRGEAMSIDHGLIWLGPISEKKGNLEFKTLDFLLSSIKEKGYLRNNDIEGDIASFVLVKDSEFKFFINKGNHRISVLTAMGFESVPIRIEHTTIPSFIYRSEVEYWPGVFNGLYTKEQALTVFDTIFYGKKDWSYGS